MTNVFLTDEEYNQSHPNSDISIQAEVEQPEIYILACGSSSVEDQSALVGDRVSCLMDLANPVKTEDGMFAILLGITQLYNSSRVQMELCSKLFSSPKKLSKSKMFGLYLHSLTAHAPTQYEPCCLRSLNTENQERLFGQARTIAQACTNHHADNVIPHVLVRIQAQQENRKTMSSVERGDTQVSHVARHMPKLPGTTVSSSFIAERKDSWQAHLERISPFLIAGQGVWWVPAEGGFHFFDGNGDSDIRNGNEYELLHFRKNVVRDVENRRKRYWKRIVEEKNVLPATEVKVY